MSGTLRNSSAVSLALTVLCAALGWLIYDESRAPQDVPAAAPTVTARALPDSEKAAPMRASPVLPPVDVFGETIARPLFNASRRPIVADEPPPQVRKSELNIMLSGIVIDHTRQIAHLRSATDKRVQALSVGDEIDSWRIEAIEPDRVVLRAGNQLETLFIQDFVPENSAGGATERARKPDSNSRRSRLPERSGWRSRTTPRNRQPGER